MPSPRNKTVIIEAEFYQIKVAAMIVWNYKGILFLLSIKVLMHGWC